MTHRALLRGALLCAVLINTWQLAACGGRVRTYREVYSDDDDGGVVAGSSSSGSAGSATARAGAPAAGGAPGVAGSASGGATNVCPPCPAIACGPGSHAQFLPGQCCPICVDDPTTSCAEGRMAYQAEKSQLLNKYEFGCTQDGECSVINADNACERCAFAAVWSATAISYQANVDAFAATYCSACPPQPEPPCAPPTGAYCIGNVCRLK